MAILINASNKVNLMQIKYFTSYDEQESTSHSRIQPCNALLLHI